MVLRRAAALLLALVVTAGVLSVVASSTANAAASVDQRLSARDCALTGRVFLPGRGCARQRCVKGARLDKEGRDAELCKRTGRGGAPFGQPINSRRCRDLGRVWIDETNICASNPDRTRKVIKRAPQCRQANATYISHSEEEGYYDECLAPHRLRKVRRAAAREDVSLERAARHRSRHNCSYRAGWEMSGDVCVVRQGPPRPQDLGGLLITGDSVSWRADDELYARKPEWVFDLRPGRRLDELADRLAWFRANHGEPDRIIIQLGTNRRAGYDESEFRATMATIAPVTPVMLVLPFRHPGAGNAHLVEATERYAGWMKELAADRSMTCLADWPSYAAENLHALVDGEHPDSRHEDWFARYLVRSWKGCERQLGL